MMVLLITSDALEMSDVRDETSLDRNLGWLSHSWQIRTGPGELPSPDDGDFRL